MKKLISLLVCLLMLASLAACGGDPAVPDEQSTAQPTDETAAAEATEAAPTEAEPTEAAATEAAPTEAAPTGAAPDHSGEPTPEQLTFARSYLDELDLPVWDGAIETSFAGGSGTYDDPYLIATGGQLLLLRETCIHMSVEDTYFALSSDIVMNRIDDLEAAAAAGDAYEGNTFRGVPFFEGYLDGRGHTIYGLVSPNGLFDGISDGTVVRVNIDNSVIGVGDNTTGCCGGIAGTADGRFDIEYCTFNGIMTLDGGIMGGIVGKADDKDSSSSISCCVNFGRIGGAGAAKAGGIVGSYTAKKYSDVSNCVNMGAVAGECAGGIAGEAVAKASSSGGVMSLSRCENYGEVSAASFAAGIAGYAKAEAGRNLSFLACRNLTDKVPYGIISTAETVGDGTIETFYCTSYARSLICTGATEAEGCHEKVT